MDVKLAGGVPVEVKLAGGAPVEVKRSGGTPVDVKLSGVGLFGGAVVSVERLAEAQGQGLGPGLGQELRQGQGLELRQGQGLELGAGGLGQGQGLGLELGQRPSQGALLLSRKKPDHNNIYSNNNNNNIYNNNNIAINSSIINGKINTNKTTTVLTKYPLAKCREISRQVSENNNTKTICRRLNLWSGATVTLPFIKPAIISNRTRLIIFIILVLSYIYNYYILKNIYPQP